MADHPIDRYYARVRRRLRGVVCTGWFVIFSMGAFGVMLVTSWFSSAGVSADITRVLAWGTVGIIAIAASVGAFLGCRDKLLRENVIDNLLELFPEQSRHIEILYAAELVGAEAEDAKGIVSEHLQDNLPIRWGAKILVPPAQLQRWLLISSGVLIVLLSIGGTSSFSVVQEFSEDLLEARRYHPLSVVEFSPRQRWYQEPKDWLDIEVELDRLPKGPVHLIVEDLGSKEKIPMVGSSENPMVFSCNIRMPQQKFSVMVESEQKRSDPQLFRYYLDEMVELTALRSDEGSGMKKLAAGTTRLRLPVGSTLEMDFKREDAPLLQMALKDREGEVLPLERGDEPFTLTSSLQMEENMGFIVEWQWPNLKMARRQLFEVEVYEVHSPKVQWLSPRDGDPLDPEKELTLSWALEDDWGLERSILFITDYHEVNIQKHVMVENEGIENRVENVTLPVELLKRQHGAMLGLAVAIIDRDPHPKVNFSKVIHLIHPDIKGARVPNFELVDEFWSTIESALDRGDLPQLMEQDYQVWMRERMERLLAEERENQAIENWLMGMKRSIVEDNNGGIDPVTGKPTRYIYHLIDGKVKRELNPAFGEIKSMTKVVNGKLVKVTRSKTALRPFVPAEEFVLHQDGRERSEDFLKKFKYQPRAQRNVLSASEWESRISVHEDLLKNLRPEQRILVLRYYRDLRKLQSADHH